jgi:uncharacterized membrane protein YtjA (UPF0391 family)
MLHYALVFLVVAIIAAVLGFGGIAGAAAGIAKILFLVTRRPCRARMRSCCATRSSESRGALSLQASISEGLFC